MLASSSWELELPWDLRQVPSWVLSTEKIFRDKLFHLAGLTHGETEIQRQEKGIGAPIRALDHAPALQPPGSLLQDGPLSCLSW